MRFHTTLEFNSEQQRTDFLVLVAQSGVTQKRILEAMIDEVLSNKAHKAAILAKAKKK